MLLASRKKRGRALRHVLAGEAGDALVLVRELLERGAGDVAVEVVERRIAHQLLHPAKEPWQMSSLVSGRGVIAAKRSRNSSGSNTSS